MEIPPFTKQGGKLAGRSGILELMDDLGETLAGAPGMRMMGGGNPANIPEISTLWRRRMRDILSDGEEFDRMLGNYDPPAGNPAFREALAGLLNRTFGWPVTADHIAVTAGGQSAFFLLFNLLAGELDGGVRKKVLLPLVPEYIGYANQGLGDDFFTACFPKIEILDDRTFKYKIDFDTVEAQLGEDIAAVCVSRPTNPTGNVLTDAEIARLAGLCRNSGKPLIIDGAYGAPFPGILFEEVEPVWDDGIILTLSLSKLGLPGTRTGIVVARPEIARAVTAMTSVVGLANENIGQAIVRPLVESGEILDLSRRVIRPFYEKKSRDAVSSIHHLFPESAPVFVHKSEGALFLWLWFRGLPISSKELYERLKARKVLVVPGEYFFFGTSRPWNHSQECIRVTFSQDDKVVGEGIRIIEEEVRRVFKGW